MGFISRGSQKWSFTWKSLLMVWLSFCIQVTAGQVSISPPVQDAAVGETATLSVRTTVSVLAFNWYRGTVIYDPNRILSYRPGPPFNQTSGPQHTGREKALPNGDLEITRLLTTDTGNYTLQIVRSDFTTQQATAQLRVYERVSIPVIHVVPQNPIENGSLALFCNASGTQVSYRWYWNDTLINAGGRISLSNESQTVTLSSCSRSDTGTNFTCRASNVVSNASSSPYTVTISYGPGTPVISANPEESVYAAGSTLTLSCTAASYPPALYTWLLNGQSLKNTGPELLINPLTLSDSGNYTCNTSNSVTHLSNHGTRDIHIMEPVTKPTVQYSSSQLVENRGPAIITCDNSSATETILWYINGKQFLPDNTRVTLTNKNRTLTIANVSRSDSGIYQCQAINPVSNSRSEPQTLTVAYGPQNVKIDPPGDQILPAGTKLTLTCTAASFPDPTYQWFLNNTDLNQPTRTLTVQRVSSRDEGNYTCVAHNTLTSLSHNAKVYIAVNGTDPTGSNNNNNLPPGAIAGIVVGVLAFSAVVAGLVYYFVFMKPATGPSTSVPMHSTATEQKNTEAPPNTKANGNAEEIQYSSVNFVPKAAPPAKPTNENTVYSEVRR